jgi:hypothetical protein
MSARVGLGTKAGLRGDDRGSKVPLGQVVFGRDGSVLGPEIEAIGLLAEDLLDVSDSQMASGTIHGREDLGFDLEGFGAEAGSGQGLVASSYGQGEQRRQGTDKGQDLPRVGKLLFQVLHFP